MKTPSFWYRPSGFISTLLAPLSLLYMAGRMVDVLTTRPQPFGTNVIVVGNAVAGGAGKTPTTIALAKLLQSRSVATQIVTRGYGGSESGPYKIKSGDVASMVGDEALLLADAVPTWVARNRALGIGCALSSGAQAVLLDDGLQHTKIMAGTNILVVDGGSGFGNGQMLPAGPLREPVAAILSRVSAVIIIGDDRHNIARLAGGAKVFRARLSVDASKLSGKFVAFTGLARPEKFFASAQGAGLQVAATKSFPDHYLYSADDRAALRAWAAENDASLLTTEKDAVRWPEDERTALSVLPLTLMFDDENAIAEFLLKRVSPYGA